MTTTRGGAQEKLLTPNESCRSIGLSLRKEVVQQMEIGSNRSDMWLAQEVAGR